MMRSGKTLTIRRPFIGCILLTSAVLLPSPSFADDATKEQDLRADVVNRCYNVIGEFGAEGVEVCVKGELSAMRALMAYPPEAGEIVRRCARQVQITGWELAKTCADRDIAAARETKKD